MFRHPLYARDSLGVLGDYVTLEAGTGAVHTAPGHGADDYKTGVRYGLEIYAPLDPGGHLQRIGRAVRRPEGHGTRIRRSKRRSRSAASSGIARISSTQYPHCWRCHNPVIFLATSQWFIAMDAKQFRERALQVDHATRAGSRRGARRASKA